MSGQNYFSPDETIRYSRHFVLPGFGKEAQQKLRNARVMVVGAGGLGAPVLYYLAAAGIGRIGIADADTVSLSNLQRQILFTLDDIGKNKARQAAQRLKALNAEVEFEVVENKITSANALTLLKGYEVVVDATDNFPTRYLLNDASVLLNIPLVCGSVFRYEGQVAVFNFNGGPNYRDLYPTPPVPGSVPDCEQGGVLGVLPGLIGCYQANETIKLITGLGESLAGRLLLVDSLTLETSLIRIPDQNQKASIKNLIDYDHFCGLTKTTQAMKEVTVLELKALIDKKADFQLIDVREPHEFDICNLDGELIPQAEIPHNVDKIAKDKQVIIHCRSGARSGNMVNWLEKNHGFTNLYNLKGGILAWADQIDPSMTKY
jgi:sulfur-carrier protein adenylyltransferase/sulfurtransferase